MTDFFCSTMRLILLGQKGIWQDRRARLSVSTVRGTVQKVSGRRELVDWWHKPILQWPFKLL